MSTDTEPALKPTIGQPEYVEAFDPQMDDHDGSPMPSDPAFVGWDLSVGSQITFSADYEGGFYVYLGLSDDAIANRQVHRAVTREQVLAFAEHLLRLVDAKPVLTLVAPAEVTP